jgi:hypothetical protein
MKKVSNNERGSIILVFIITLPFLIAMAIYYTSLSLTSFQVARLDQLHTEAQLAADAGADFAIEQIGQDNTWTGTSGDVLLHSDSKLLTKYNVTVTGDDTAKTIAVTGKTFWPANKTTPARTVRIYVDLWPVSGGTYSVITGEGGLYMSNKAKIVGGDVFVNGEINLSNSAQIGLSTKSVGVKVANERCPNPADSTYPRVCNSGENGQPITIANTAHIYGAVQATGQTDGSNMSNTGLISGSVSPQALPSYDRSAQKAAVSNNMTGAAASCSSNNGTLTWPANTKITGNVNIGLKCKVTVQGDVWITGNLTMDNTSQMIVADSLGTNTPHIMVDGSSGATFNQSAALTANASGTGFEILTFYSTAGCSPDCSSVTGTSLASSRSVPTITLSQSASAGKTIFYAYWTQVSVGNTGQIGALIGQTININNSGTITFGTSTQTGAPTVWAVKGYRRQ